MSKRQYRIPLPYETSAKDALAIEAGLGKPEVQAALKRLDPHLVAKLKAVGVFSPQTFTKAELDGVPDDLWAKLAPHLG